MGKYSEENYDMQDPILLKDIHLSRDKVDFLSSRADPDAPRYCFMCKWILEDFQKNGTLTGYKQTGELGDIEIFPIRGEITHLWLEMYGKPYPFKRKVIPEEMQIQGGKKAQEPPARPLPPADSIPLSTPKHLKKEEPPQPPQGEGLSQVPLSRPKKKD